MTEIALKCLGITVQIHKKAYHCMVYTVKIAAFPFKYIYCHCACS